MNATLTVYADVRDNTSIKLYLSNDYFYTQVLATNSSEVIFPDYGRQLGFKIELNTTNSSVSPSIKAVTVNSTGLPYNETNYTREKLYHSPYNSHGVVNKYLNIMDFNYDSQDISYRLNLYYYVSKINLTYDYLIGFVQLFSNNGWMVTNQINYLKFDINITINNLTYRIFGKNWGKNPSEYHDELAKIYMFQILIEHDYLEMMCLKSNFSYYVWNDQGGNASGTTQFDENVYRITEISITIPAYDWFFSIIGIILVVTIIIALRNKQFFKNIFIKDKL